MSLKLKLGWWAVQEHYQPDQSLEWADQAGRAGFDSIISSDHFHPWTHTGASAGFCWTWMSSCAERVPNVLVGSGVTAPEYRYHPGIIAQAFATMAKMYPDRIFLGLGTGEAMNEVPLGFEWPGFKERLDRLSEAVDIIHDLWTGQFVTYNGKYWKVNDAKLYTLPDDPPQIYLSGTGPSSSKLAGEKGDALITLPGKTNDAYKNQILKPFYETARKYGRDPERLEKAVGLKVSYAENYEDAVKPLRFWAANAIPGILKTTISDPRRFEELGEKMRTEDIAKTWKIVTKIEDLIPETENYLRLGFNHVIFNSTSPDGSKFIQDFGRHVIPYLKEEYNEGVIVSEKEMLAA